jgi:arabinan endo-1,5-alpha-L-arabinosidase
MALTDNLQAFYKLSDLSDSSGNNRTLTNNGNVSFASGKIGNAAVFDGEDRSLSNNLSLVSNNGASVSMWFKGPNLFDGGYEHGPFSWNCLFSLNGNGNTIQVHPITYGNVGLVFANWDTNTFLNTETNVLDDVWHHIVLSISSSGVAEAFVDGIKIGEANDFATSLNTTGLVLGLDAVGSANAKIAGQIDAVGIWNRALSDAEVAALYNSGTGLELDGVAQPTLVKMQAPVKFFGKVKFGV